MIRKALRLVALIMFRRGIDKKIVEPARDTAAEILYHHFEGQSPSIRMATPVGNDPLSHLIEARGRAVPIDLVFEVTLAEGPSPDVLFQCAQVLRSHFEGIADPETSDILVGTAHFIIEGTGNIFIALGSKRDPGISVEDMRRWWLEQHAPLVQKIVRPQSKSYEQLHVDRDLSQLAAEAAGFVFEPYDLFDTIIYDEVSHFVEVITNEEIGRQLYEDEIGRIDHASWRGAVCGLV